MTPSNHDRMMFATFSQTPGSCKHRSSGRPADNPAAHIGQRHSRRPRWLRVHAPTRMQTSCVNLRVR